MGGVIDDVAVVRPLWCHEFNYFPAVIETCTGHRGRQIDHPTLGSWVSYALETANKNLPTFVNIGRPSSPVQLTGGYLVAATPFHPGETPIPNLKPPLVCRDSAVLRSHRPRCVGPLRAMDIDLASSGDETDARSAQLVRQP